MSKRLYPIGHQDFSKIITQGQVYVDKTYFVNELAQKGGYYFLSRPRRFGKSLFLSTMDYLFQGEKELFKGLYAYDQWKFEPYPIIRISFNTLAYENNQLELSLKKALHDIAASYDLLIAQLAPKEMFAELIQKLFEKYQKGVVILIDEYDKPLVDYLDKDNLSQAIQNRAILKAFYSILKNADKYLKILFITGVSKFSKVSIFSDLNNLTDLSTARDFNEICGITQKELEDNFVEELKIYDKEEIKRWYNGYKFHQNGQTLYNPFSLLSFFLGGGDYKNFWFATGTPTFLMKLCRDNHLYKFEEISMSDFDLGNFDIEKLSVFPILFQTGYLTIKGENKLFRSSILGFPNEEVRESYLRNLANLYIGSEQYNSNVLLDKLTTSLKTKDQELMKNTINLAFSQIPYDLWQRENEQYYHAIVHLLFSLLDVYIFSEVHTQNGRADAIVIHDNEIYCLEFKLNQSAEMALAQIKERGYTERFQNKGLPIHHIGINFSSENRKVEGLLWESLNSKDNTKTLES
jgi:hypothetical protein